MTFALLVFDLDGTLVDSRRDLAIAVNLTLGEFGGAALDEAVVGDLVGDGASVLVTRAFQASGVDALPTDALARFIANYTDHLLDHTRPYPGIPDLLESAGRRAQLAVLTNKPLAATRRMLDALDLSQHFTRVIGGDEACGRKPDPTGLRSLVTEAGAAADATLMIGDSHIDLETARRAGTPMCLVRYGFGFRKGLLEKLGPGDLSVASPAELLEYLR